MGVNHSHFDLKARARQAMLEAGFHPDFPPEAAREIQDRKQNEPATLPVRDLRSLLWSSIDNDTSRDLDQVEYTETLPDGGIRLLVGIADVDGSVSKGSAIDAHAATETTSVYTGVTVFPMLPSELSNDATSLLDQQDRISVVIEVRLGPKGEAQGHDFYLAQIRNRAKLAYSSTGAWLEGHGPTPPAVAAVPGMEAQIRLQKATAEKLGHIRKQHGALAFSSLEATPEVEDGTVKELRVREHTVASDIIESFMIAANVAMATFLRSRGSLSIRRVVKTPKRWDRIQAIAIQFGTRLPDVPDPRALSDFLDRRRAADPEHFSDLSLSIVKLLGRGEYIVETPGQEQTGHFGLAENHYTHSTAPNRRYADLVTQRLLKTALSGGGSNVSSPGSNATPYTQAELSAVAARCTEREDAANKVERLMRKVAAACLLSNRIGESFDGVVTGASAKGTWVRLYTVPVEGRIVRGEKGMDVGDKVHVRLSFVDVANGFIDFEATDRSRVAGAR